MSERIYGSITEDFIRRMRNWAKAGAGLCGPAGSCASSIYEGGVRVDRSPVAEIPVLMGDADDVSEALQMVPIRYRQAVMQFWALEGRPLRWHGRKRGINHETFEAWVIKGHEILAPALTEHVARARQRAVDNLASISA